MNHASNSTQFIADQERTHWHDQALWFVRSKRDKITKSIPDWEKLRATADAIKSHTMSKMAHYLELFEENAKKNGIHVHWAIDGNEHNQIVHKILSDHGVKKIVKSKSMLTEECHLNPYLEKNGIEVVDTDLGERIVQLRKETPSHIVLPAIHIRKEEVGDCFHEHLGTEQGASDPEYLTEAARQHLRQKFVAADAGVTGVNFAIAETGGFVVCTNEGNADLGTSLPKLHIACMGMEKIIPRAKDLGVFLRLLARSATGQPVTTYNSHFHGPVPGGELHIVLVDNGRSKILASDDFRRSLNCIRCGACMNTCPVYRRSGGHSYGHIIPGPIGSILAPNADVEKHNDLPFASSLCGSCTDVCPVKIDLHHQLLAWRKVIAKQGFLPFTKRFSMKVAGIVFNSTWLFNTAGKLGRLALRILPRFMVYNRLNTWTKQRDLPEAPKQSFRELYQIEVKTKRREQGNE